MKISLKDTRDDLTAQQAGNMLAQMIEESLNLNDRKFTISTKKLLTPGNLEIIYNSEWCRVKFIYSRERPNLPSYDELRVFYGRSHALDKGNFMEWEGQICWCWHDVFDALWFLDGLSPLEAIQYEKENGPLPPLVNGYWESEIGKKLRKEFPPQFTLSCHAMIWMHYKQNLFDLFDVRKSSIWNQYKKFIGEFLILRGTKTYFGQPPKDNIC